MLLMHLVHLFSVSRLNLGKLDLTGRRLSLLRPTAACPLRSFTLSSFALPRRCPTSTQIPNPTSATPPSIRLLLSCRSSLDPVDLPVPVLKLAVDAQLKVSLHWCLNGPSAI
ncbi:hypothetical protein V2J09_003569 [Rumex salicifolius]